MSDGNASEVTQRLMRFLEAARARSNQPSKTAENMKGGVQTAVVQPRSPNTPIADIYRAAIDRLDLVERAELARLLEKMTATITAS
jgi:hypothetical protein